MALLTTQPCIQTAASGDATASQPPLTGLPGDHPRTDHLRAGRLDDLNAIETLALEELGSIDATPAQDMARLLFGEGGERERVHERWRRLIRNETFRHRPGRSPAQQTVQSYEWLRLVNDAIGEPESLATDPSLLASLHEWAAIVDGGGGLCTVASIHYNLFLGSLLDHEPSEHRDLSEFTSMRRIGTFLCTELDHGNDAAALETTAELDPFTGGFVLHTPHSGAQKFMPNTSTTGGPKTAVVAARLITNGQDQGVYLFLTPLSDEHGLLPGIRVRRLPMRPGAPVDHCLTAFNRVRLPREALLEAEHGRLGHDGVLTSTLGNRRKRFLRSIGRVTVGKICMSGAAVGASRAALAIAVRYGEHRRVTGPKAGQRIPVNAHRTHHGRLLKSLATAYAMTFLHRSAVTAWTRHTDETREEAERLVAVAKGWITWQARAITTECRERCGAQGLFAVNALAGFPDYVEGTVTAEGDNLVIWAKAAAELLFATAATGSRTAARTGPRELTNPRFLRSLLAQAEAIWQRRARAALRRGPAKDPVARWNRASSPALEMVSVHAGLRAADAFLEAAERVTQPETRQLLDGLCLLFLLEQIRSHTGDLLMDAHMSAEQVGELPFVIDTVVDGLAPRMRTLVDAFDLPEEYLAAIPIANGGRVPLADYADIAE
ncbi:acyl-CoA dehydrogenase family protein [Streptomyces sp. NBC_00557]|uniref:acyl-CoA dehydrogenase family protein n=1 Tax=Streptomyces sp. NBC_00557 TaxID=2975776 RepID=UPI002E8028B9|nr:acyl-CoA dehydrogenase [Streptomyces sp. NBC_00557]WUC40159.1 acyl-CoA oxidase [Streptomyces sp. NBC_00557]